MVDKTVEKMEMMWVVWKVGSSVKMKAVWRASKMVVDWVAMKGNWWVDKMVQMWAGMKVAMKGSWWVDKMDFH